MNKLMLPNEQAIRTYIEDIYVRGVELGKTKIEFHTFLQNQIAALASEFFLTPEKEYALPNFRSDHHNGCIDVVWAIGSIPVVAIEIDSALREKSVKKLLSSNSNLLFWVYYGFSPFESFVNSIDPTNRIKVIHFPTKFGKFGVKLNSKTIQHTEVSKKGSTSSRSYSVSNLRLKYPNAYEKWSDEQDKFLNENFLKGLAVSELAKHLQRKPGAIRSRIKKLGLS